MKRFVFFTCLALLALGLTAPATAGEKSLEALVGYYDPDAYGDHGEVFGARFGYRPADRFGMLLSAGVLDIEDDFLGIDDSQLRFDLYLVDLSFQWYPTGNDFYLFAGPGWATLDLKVDLPGPGNNIEASDDIFTLHAGLGYQWKLGDSFFLRPEARARWFDGQEFDSDDIDAYDGLDTEYSLAFGWRF